MKLRNLWMFLKSFKFLLSLLMILFLSASFTYAELLFLSGAVKEALERNADVAAAKRIWESAKAKIPQALSLSDPRIGLEYEQIPSGVRDVEQGMKMIKAEQMIMFPGKIAAEYLMAGREAEMYSALYRAKVLEITSLVKSTYYNLFFTDRSIEIIEEIRDLLSKIKKTAEAKYIVGDVVQADVLQANIEYLIMENEFITLQQERKAGEAKLKALLNQRDEAAIETESNFNFPKTLEVVSEIEKTTLEKRPELLAMKAEFEMKDYAHLKSKMEFFPDTMLGVRKRVTDGWDAMLSFSVPLYFWKQSYGIRLVGLEREAAEAAYNNMKNMTIWMLKESWVMADSARRTVKLYEDKIVPQSSQALKIALAAYQTGKVDFQTLLNIERGYKEAKLKLYENQVNYGKALAGLERIIGGELR